ncbi:MAG: nickel pincer cofactor biosynthesis protein LarB [Rhodospirillales bacterium]|nr:nickel pincer cofactor biosynthesis protein LarB [Rhodospirillales bacterium]
MTVNDVILDLERKTRIGMPEAIFCAGKTVQQISRAIAQATDADSSILLTHLDESKAAAISTTPFDYDPISQTAIAGPWTQPVGAPEIAIVGAGTSDMPVISEASRTLAFHGLASEQFVDVGVSGLWRLLKIRDQLADFPVIIAVAGMEGALFSVLGGLVPGLIVAVPTSRGYGICRNGETALHSALASCAQGMVAVNIDNGYGAACAAIRSLGK